MNQVNAIYQQIVTMIIRDISLPNLETLISQKAITSLIDETIELITEKHKQLIDQQGIALNLQQFYSMLVKPYNVPITHWLDFKPNRNLIVLTEKIANDKDTITPPTMPTTFTKPICTPKFYLPNLKVGEFYSSTIEIKSMSAENEVIIEDVLFNQQNSCFKFDQITKIVEGTPLTSGSYTFTIVWHIEGSQSQLTDLEVIINPDPNSLWKDIPANEQDPYFKPSLVHQYIKTDQIQIAAASRRGRSHAHVGSFRDDDFFIENLANNWNITIVADGAGSANNSRKGSQLAVNTIGQYFKHQLLINENQVLLNYIQQWNHQTTQKVGQKFKTWFRDAALLAIKQLEVEADKTNNSLKSFSTTILVAITLKIANELFAATFSIGDGAIAAFSFKDNIRILSTSDNGEYAGQTRFLDQAIVREQDFYNRIRIGKWQDISYFLLMTDGITDPKFETDYQLNNTDNWRQLITELTPILKTSVDPAEGLLNWMQFSSPGNHDDRTLIVLW